MEFTMDDEMFAEWEAEIAAEYEDADVMARIPEMEMPEVLDRIRALSVELTELGELKPPLKTPRGLELHQLWVKLKTRQHDIMEAWPDEPDLTGNWGN